MKFSVPNAETRAACELTTSYARLVRDPFIRQLMRIGVIFVALLFTTLQVLMATPGHGQSAASTTITLELHGESLVTALKKIEHLTPYRFVYRNEEIRDIGNLSLPSAQRTVHETLELLLANTLTSVIAGTAPVFLTSFVTSQGLFLAKVCAAATVVSLPVIIAGFAAQDKLVQGLSLGAVK